MLQRFTRSTVVLAGLAVLVLASAPGVAAADGYDRSPWEFTLAGTGSSDKDFDTNTVGADASLGYVYGDLVNDRFIAGPEAGLKLYFHENHDVFIFGRIEYQFFFEDSDNADDTFEDGQFVYSIGVGFGF